jgi:hypothetical protein
MDKKLIYFIAAFLIFYAANARAEDEKPYIFSPPGCEFSATLPSEPAISKRCPETAKAGCYDVAKYVKVYDYNATINFEFSCNLITEDIRAAYNKETIEAVLTSAVRRKGVDEVPQIFYNEPKSGDTTYKIAAVSGMRKAGVTEKLYIHQLWMGEKSLMLIDAELSEASHIDADKTFAEILKSVHIIGDEEEE